MDKVRVMSTDEIAETVSSWFRIAKVGGLILPDGWFGRPYDSLHALTYIAVRPHKLLLELDNQLLLVLTDLSFARLQGSDLILSDFVQCVFDWQEYGTLAAHVQVYSSGQVIFASPPGVVR